MYEQDSSLDRDWSSKKCFSEIILAAIIDMWLDVSCVEEPQRGQPQ